jgi:hypothetical protein
VSTKSQRRRLARKYPKKPRDYSLGLDWSGAGAPSDPIAYLHRIVEQSDRRWANARMTEHSAAQTEVLQKAADDWSDEHGLPAPTVTIDAPKP